MELRLCPVGGLQVEHYNIGEVLAMLVLTAEDQEFVALPEVGCVAWYSRSAFELT
jgi:hypothetical protein